LGRDDGEYLGQKKIPDNDLDQGEILIFPYNEVTVKNGDGG